VARSVGQVGERRQIIRFGRKLFVAVALAAIAATLSVLSWPPERFLGSTSAATLLGPFHEAEKVGYDALMGLRGPRRDRVDDRIVIVGFDRDDEFSLNHNWPVPRRLHAQAIRNIAADGAKVIVYDVLFSGHTDPVDDRALDAALKETKNVILTARLDRDIARRRKGIEAPYHDDLGIDFEANTKVGIAEVPPDPGSKIIRSFVPLMWFQDEIYPSLPVAAYLAMNNLDVKDIKVRKDAVYIGSLRVPRTGPTLRDEQDNSEIPFVKIDYPGGIGSFASTAPFSQVVGEKPTFSPGTFKDKIVFVGLTGAQIVKSEGEGYLTAYSHFNPDMAGSVVQAQTPGVIIQALHFNALLKHTFVRETTDTGIWGMVFLMTLAAIALVRRFSNLLGLLLVVACGGVVFAFAYLCLRFAGLHVPWIVPSGLILASAGGVGWLESGSIKRRWAGYVSPAVLEQILQSEESIGAQRYDASVMFGDIRGFTSFSEKHSPEAVVYLLNRHLEKMTAIISREHGTIDKFLGDGILAVFGAPIQFRESALAAVRAAWYMREAALQPVFDDKGEPHVLATGFGITTGGFLGGDIGSKQLRNWTIIGDTVNLASRLQGVTGEPDVIIDEPTYALVRQHVAVESLGAVTLKGKSQPVPCYKVVAWSETPIPDPAHDKSAMDAVATK
jgi:adenylate cyclase